MDSFERREKRAAVIREMNEMIDNTEDLGLPFISAVMMAIPMVLWVAIVTSVRLTLAMIWHMLTDAANFLSRPFVAIYLWFDLLMIQLWLFGTVAKKMSGRIK